MNEERRKIKKQLEIIETALNTLLFLKNYKPEDLKEITMENALNILKGKIARLED